MDRVNPVYIPRNHLVEEALAAATDGDLDPFERLLDAVTATLSTSGPASSGTPSRPRTTSAPTRPSAAPEVPAPVSPRGTLAHMVTVSGRILLSRHQRGIGGHLRWHLTGGYLEDGPFRNVGPPLSFEFPFWTAHR